MLTANATDLAGNVSVKSAATTAIIGTAGDDVLSDTPGTAAAMVGGAGNDIFKYLAGNFGADTITDFDSNPVGGQDLIDLTGRGITAATFAASVKIGASGVSGVNTLITIGASSITLDQVAWATVNATDFRLAP